MSRCGEERRLVVQPSPAWRSIVHLLCEQPSYSGVGKGGPRAGSRFRAVLREREILSWFHLRHHPTERTPARGHDDPTVSQSVATRRGVACTVPDASRSGATISAPAEFTVLISSCADHVIRFMRGPSPSRPPASSSAHSSVHGSPANLMEDAGEPRVAAIVAELTKTVQSPLPFVFPPRFDPVARYLRGELRSSQRAWTSRLAHRRAAFAAPIRI
jgi:hypothetical protein